MPRTHNVSEFWKQWKANNDDGNSDKWQKKLAAIKLKGGDRSSENDEKQRLVFAKTKYRFVNDLFTYLSLSHFEGLHESSGHVTSKTIK